MLRTCLMTLLSLAGFMVCASPMATLAAPPPAPEMEFFEAKIRPVLVEQCYKCHNSLTRTDGELAVDHRSALLKGGQSGPVIVPGKPLESRLLPILRHDVVGLKMPEDGAKLDDQVIADFEKWIAMGAPDSRDHAPTSEQLAAATSWDQVLKKRKAWWSFQPIRDVPIPQISNNSWSQHPVDQFILATLREKGLEPGEAADPRVLVRRLYFALIGLPPTSDEIQSWTKRLEQPDGFESLVNHLIESPHFGERWARHWMDWIRYAETHGSEGDPAIENAWQYRDYLIRALNADVAYDQLVREHVAGDLLEQPRLNRTLGINESAIGPAHWRMVFHGFAPTDPLDEKVRYTDDEINVFSKAFLGLTVACARCHNHKFDPISQSDYYALFGILGACRPGRTAINTPEQLSRNRAALVQLKPKIRSAMAQDWRSHASELQRRLLTEQGLWQQADQPRQLLHHWSQLRKDLADGLPLAEAWNRRQADWNADRQRRTEFAAQRPFQHWKWGASDDQAKWYRAGIGLPEQPALPGEFAVAPTGENALAGIYPAGVYTHLLSGKHAGCFSSEDVHLDQEYELWVRAIGEGGASVRYVVQDYPRDGTVFPIRKLSADWQWQKFDLTYWNGDDIHVELATGQDAPVIVNNEPRSWFGISEAVIVRKGESGPATESSEFLDPLFEAVMRQPPLSLEDLTDRYVEAIMLAVKAWEANTASDAQARLLDACLKQGLLSNRLELLATAQPLINVYRQLEEAIVVPTRVPSLQETVGRKQRLFERGNHKLPGDEVPRRFLEAIDPTPYQTTQSGRRQLAEDLFRDDNPLTRRVIVNRIWHHLFGRGLVGTPDNFGRLGLAPTHPELLDHLATRFKKSGGSMKEMIRLIVTSKTWQLTSQPSAQSRLKDPENQYLTHANLKRLEAEAIRDSLLSATQNLNQTVFGPPVEGNSPRRSLYVRVARNSPDPFLRAYDFPEPFSTVGRRDVTNVPAQSLTMMNDERVSGLASAWSIQMLSTSPTSRDDERLQNMFLTALGRPALPAEIRQLEAYLMTVRSERIETLRQVTELRRSVDERKAAIQSLVEPIRQKKMAELNPQLSLARPQQHAPQPIGRWQFDGDLRDVVGVAHGQLFGAARLEKGHLELKQQGYVMTAPLTQNIQAKTLEVWVQLDNLEQRGGGAMTIWSRGGEIFDSIVFGEQSPQQWLAGSNLFQRTQSFQGPPETEAVTRPVHFAIVYQSDGLVLGYRDGRPYGKPYQTNGPQLFKAGEAVVGLGIRHLPAGGNRMLEGRLLRAQLYDRALSADEVRASSQSSQLFVSDIQIQQAMSEVERQQWKSELEQIARLESQIKASGPLIDVPDEQAVWADMAQALFTFQEFIFVK